ncbi:MAG: hypothetical protein ACK56I_35825, partial [bacterium]
PTRGEGSVGCKNASMPTEPVKFSAVLVCGGGVVLRVMLMVFDSCVDKLVAAPVLAAAPA